MTPEIKEKLLGLINEKAYNPLKKEELALIFDIHSCEMPMFNNFLEELQDEKVVFSKDGTTNVLQPNKYYIGEKDGYFAIYKTDSEGNLTIENEDDVYRDSRSINFLQGEDLEDIKNLKHCYDTKDEAIEKLTAYIS